MIVTGASAPGASHRGLPCSECGIARTLVLVYLSLCLGEGQLQHWRFEMKLHRHNGGKSKDPAKADSYRNLAGGVLHFVASLVNAGLSLFLH